MGAKRILVVDDSATLCKSLSATSGDASYGVTDTDGGNAALDMIAEGHIELLMTNLSVPDMNGISLINRIRTIPGQLFTPILVMSEESKTIRYPERLRTGASGYLL